MSIDIIVFIFGATLFATGLWGGNVTVRELSVPKIGTVPRLASVGAGLFLILLGIGLHSEINGSASTSDSSDSAPIPAVPPLEPAPVVAPPASTEQPIPAPAVEDSDPDQAFKAEVGTRLIAINDRLGLDGYELSHEPYLGQLEENTQESISIVLAAGSFYAIIGVCDSDCQDMDIAVYDQNGNLVGSDTETDNIPVVEVSPQWDGPFSIQVSMPTCSASYCYYGVGVFGQ